MYSWLQLETQMSRQMETSDLNQMALYLNSSTLTANAAAFQGQINSDLRVSEFSKLPHPYGNISYPTENPCINNPQVALPHDKLRVSHKPIDASCAPERKRFLIFDRSGNHTRLFFNPSFSPQNQVITSTVSASTQEVECRFLLNPVVEEKWDENDLNDEEGEMVENTEEIDALLYSDSDDDDDDNQYDDNDDDGDDDEVTSTRHIPFIIEEGSMPKRQRLLDGGYKKPSWVSLKSPLSHPCNHKVDHESSFVGERNSHDGTDSSKRDKKVKIRETLNILGSIIPGSGSNKDPVSIIEKAIFYLESMRIEAEALGLTEPESKSATYT